MNKTKIITGRSHPELAQEVAKELGLELVKCELDRFSNTETKVQIKENVRGYDIYVFQTGAFTKELSINDFYMELLSIIEACYISDAASVSVVVPCYFYARADKKIKREPITGSMVTNILKFLKVKRIIAMDLHSGQAQGFARLPFDNLYAIKLHIANLRKTLFKNMSNEEINKNFVLVSPDNGGAKRVDAYANELKMKAVIMHKKRDYSQSSVVTKSVLIGEHEDIVGKTAIVIDDMVDTMGTMVSASNELKEHGVKDVIILATHGIFSGSAIERINDCKNIKKVIVADTLPQQDNMKNCDKIETVKTAPLFAEVLRRLITEGSISELFE